MTAQPAPEPTTPAIGDVGRAFLRASGRAEITGILAAVVIGPLISILVNLGLAFTPFGRVWLEIPVSWLSLSDLFFVLLLGLIWSAVAILRLPSSIRPAYAGALFPFRHPPGRIRISARAAARAEIE